MKEQLTRYVDLLFAGAPHAGDIKQEILQNTLDRYDDLIGQGKSPQAAYQLAISGIGDINEILGCEASDNAAAMPAQPAAPREKAPKPLWKTLLRAVGICLYIICPIPLFILSELDMATIGLSGTLGIVAVATALMVISGSRSGNRSEPKAEEASDPRSELHKAVNWIINIFCLAAYFIVSFATNAWYITWVIFPLMAAIRGLIKACFDLKEAGSHEN